VGARVVSSAHNLHRQAAERAVRMRSVGVHAPSHRPVRLIKGKRPIVRRFLVRSARGRNTFAAEDKMRGSSERPIE
jgi:hypothetical protein